MQGGTTMCDPKTGFCRIIDWQPAGAARGGERPDRKGRLREAMGKAEQQCVSPKQDVVELWLGSPMAHYTNLKPMPARGSERPDRKSRLREAMEGELAMWCEAFSSKTHKFQTSRHRQASKPIPSDL